MAVAHTLVDRAATAPGGRLKAGFAALIDLLMPPACIACRVPTATSPGFCADCWSALPALAGTLCQCCGLPLPLAWAAEALCLGCLRDPPDFARARAACLYDGPARRAVLAFKNGREAYAPLMAAAMRRAAPDLEATSSIVVPVPLHRWRLFARGYNQAAVLAHEIARQSGAQLALDALVRVKNTPISRGLNRAQRRRNVAGAFRVPPSARARLKDAHILLVDDVMTSGATASACARTLRRAGAAQVDVITYARVAATDITSYLQPPESQDDHGEG